MSEEEPETGSQPLGNDESPSDEDAEQRAARELLSSGLVAGPDPSVVDDVLHTPEPDEGESPAEQAEVEAEVQRIYRDILTRAPEHDVQPSLERVRHACELLGSPQLTYPVIHVAGTNGKTSTTRVIERLLREKGLRTGRFTSPHLTTVRERIAIDGEPISAEGFIDTWQHVAAVVEATDEHSQARGGPRLSFFEVFVLMAYLAFADAPVDVAIVETGMGGRWDATNVAEPRIEVLTPISRDHEKWLGSSLEQIAAEKAGIITPAATVITAEQAEEVTEVIAATARQLEAAVLSEGEDMRVVDRQLGVGGQMLVLQTPAGVYTDVFLPLHGEHQARNALLGLVAAETFFGGGALDGDVVEQGFAGVDSPARLELVRTSPTVLVDGAHNPAGIAALREAVDEAFTLQRLVGIVGVMTDKNAEAILSELVPLLDEVVITQSRSERAYDGQDLADLAEEVFDPDQVHRAERLDEAIDVATTRAESDDSQAGVLITGSILLVAEARILLGRN